MLPKNKFQNGITLIETVISISLLTTTIITIIGLAIFSFSSHNKGLNRLTALGLAREGVEVVRSIRDTNWLPPNQLTLCDELKINPEDQDQYCYQNWLENIPDACNSGCQAVFNAQNASWTLDAGLGFALYKQTPSDSAAYYTPTQSDNPITYYRQIKIVKTYPTDGSVNLYTLDHPEVQVISTVAWRGNGCPNDFGGIPESAQARCKVVVEERLTNWKDY